MGGLDINWFRTDKGFDPNIIKKSLERRFKDPKLVDTIIEEDQGWRKRKYFNNHSEI
jgi:seryl-tRNA synthetase